MNEKTITEMLAELASEICDKYCRYPYEVKTEEDLYEICEDCPVNKL